MVVGLRVRLNRSCGFTHDASARQTCAHIAVRLLWRLSEVKLVWMKVLAAGALSMLLELANDTTDGWSLDCRMLAARCHCALYMRRREELRKKRETEEGEAKPRSKGCVRVW